MSQSQKQLFVKMEDDEDLEFLRLAALKSLNNKKEVISAQVKPVHSTTCNNEFYGVDAEHSRHRNFVDNHVGNRMETMDLNDPYVPLGISSHPADKPIIDYRDYSPFSVYHPSAPIPKVQLSPRSAAFVLQNNDILMRRKGGRTPATSRSPSYSNQSPSYREWSSISPPPNKQGHRSPNKQGHRSPARNYNRRSGSRTSPHRLGSPRRSPKRSATRSPPRHANTRRYSPGQLKCTKSRSPNRNYAGNNRPRSRSPLHPSNRRISPVPRNGPKNWRGQSPSRAAQGNRPNGGHQKKSQSPRAELPPTNNYGSRRRTRSPNKMDVRKRSNSRSPQRKYGRNGPVVKKRRTPLPLRKPRRDESNAITGSDNRSSHTDNSRNNRRRRSPSPRHRRHSPTRSRPPPKSNELPASQQVQANANEELSIATNKVADSNETEMNVETEPKISPVKQVVADKIQQDIENELLASSDDEEKSIADDGIDLFASEDSESENEGRFKSSSKKTERSAGTATVSFSKLGASNTAVVRALEEVRSEKHPTNRRDRNTDRVRGDRDRDRDRNGHNRNNYSNRRNDRNYGHKSNSGERERGRDRPTGRDENKGHGSSNTWKSSKYDDAKIDDKTDRDGEHNKKSLSSRSSNKPATNDNKKSSSDDKTSKATVESRDKPVDKKSIIQLKRPTSIIVEKDIIVTIDKDKGTKASNDKSSHRRKSSSPSENTSSNSANSKKPIHLRLGAMTKTWKSNRKNWKTEKVLSIVV